MRSIVFGGLALLSAITSATPIGERAVVSRTSPPSGCLVVQPGTTNSGYYKTLGAAVGALTGTDNACIFMYSGTYELTEQVRIAYRGNLTLYGYTTNTGSYKDNAVNIQWNKTTSEAGGLDAGAALNIVSNNFKAYNINVKNTHGPGSQAVAVTANGDQQGYYGCGFYGYQDTLYAKHGTQYYSNCYIEGAVDYIFGDAAAWFGECTLASNGGGAITASSRTTSDDITWYVIDHSTVEAVAGQDLKGKVFLGRPWRGLARVMYQFSNLGDIIAPQGWTPMAAGATPVYEEFSNTGSGSNTAGRKYETKATAPVTKGQLWPNGYSWIDSSY